VTNSSSESSLTTETRIITTCIVQQHCTSTPAIFSFLHPAATVFWKPCVRGFRHEKMWSIRRVADGQVTGKSSLVSHHSQVFFSATDPKKTPIKKPTYHPERNNLGRIIPRTKPKIVIVECAAHRTNALKNASPPHVSNPIFRITTLPRVRISSSYHPRRSRASNIRYISSVRISPPVLLRYCRGSNCHTVLALRIQKML